MQKLISILFLSVIFLICAYFSYLLTYIYPRAVLDWDTITWYEHTANFSLTRHTLYETFRRLPFGLILFFSTKFQEPSKFVLYVNFILFFFSVCSFYSLTEALFNKRWLRMFSTTIVVLLSIAIQKLFLFNFIMISEASCSALTMIAACITLKAFFQENSSKLLLGNFLLGIAAFTRSVAVTLIPVWILFLFLVSLKVKSISKKTLFACFLLLITPNLLYGIRGLYLGGQSGFQLGDYLLSRALPFADEKTIFSKDPQLHTAIRETLKSIQSTPEFMKSVGNQYNVYLYGLPNHSIQGGRKWKELILERVGLEDSFDQVESEILYGKAAYDLGKHIILANFSEYINEVYARYYLLFDTTESCGFNLFDDPKARYVHNTHELFKDWISVFYSTEFKVEANEEMIQKLRLGCKIVSMSGNFREHRAIIIHAIALLFLVLIFLKTKNNNPELYNIMTTYSMFILSTLPQLALTTALHVSYSKYSVPVEMLINSSAVLLLITIVGLIAKTRRAYFADVK